LSYNGLSFSLSGILNSNETHPINFMVSEEVTMAATKRNHDEGITEQDLRLIKRVLQLYPEVEELILTVKKVASSTKYPIQSFSELAEALGGEESVVNFRNQPMSLKEVRALIPVYYFPIGSEEDLIAKIADLQARGLRRGYGEPGQEVQDISTAGALRAAVAKKPEGLTPPNISMEHILERAGFHQQPGPGIGGFAAGEVERQG
jgi:hypothetical protein